MTLARPFSATLACSHCTASSSTSATGPGEHVGVAVDQLGGDAPGHVGQGEAPSSAASTEWNTTWKSRSPSSSSRASKPSPAPTSRWSRGLEHLVRLLQQVAAQAVVGLLAIPRAVGPQPPHDLGERRHLAGDRGRQGGHVQRGEVVGGHHPVELVPRHLDHRLVRQAEALEHHHGGLVGPARRPADAASSPASTASPMASLTSDSTSRSSHWPTSSGPRSPAASAAKRCPSTRRTPVPAGRRRAAPRPGRRTTARAPARRSHGRRRPAARPCARPPPATRGRRRAPGRARRPPPPGPRRCRCTRRRCRRPARTGGRSWPRRRPRRPTGGGWCAGTAGRCAGPPPSPRR